MATRRVTTENAPLPDFFETRKDLSGVLSVPPQGVKPEKCRESEGIQRMIGDRNVNRREGLRGFLILSCCLSDRGRV